MTSGRLFKNVVWLSGLQAISYVSPLLILPVLARRLGVVEFGYVFLGLTIYQLGAVTIEYGFGYTLTAQVARKPVDQSGIGRLLTTSLLARVLIAAVYSFLITFYAMVAVRDPMQVKFILLLILPLMLGSLIPIWLFQGLERMSHAVIATALSKILYVALVLLFVRSRSDIPFIPIFLSVASLLTSLLIHRAVFSMGYRYRPVVWAAVRDEISQATGYFVSRASVFIYSAGGTLVLGGAGSAALSVYTPAEQLYRAGQSTMFPLLQALYPYVIRTRDMKMVFRLVLLLTSVGVMVTVLVGPQADLLVELIFGEAFRPSAPILQILLLSLVVSIPSMLLGYPYLGAYGRGLWVNRSVYLGAFVFMAALGFVYSFISTTAEAVAICVLLSELSVLFARLSGVYLMHRNREFDAA